MFNLNLKTDTDCELKTGAWRVVKVVKKESSKDRCLIVHSYD